MTKKTLQIEIDVLEQRRELMIEYLHDRVRTEDWHGCQDAASDIREIDAQLAIYRFQIKVAR